MNYLTAEILTISEIASFIAADNFKLLERKILYFKSNKYSPEKLYECILQSHLFCGFPAAIESLKIFRKYYDEFTKSKAKYNLSEFKKYGVSNCKLIYKKNYKKLIENMNYYSPDLKDWMIADGYGKVLGRKGLTLLEREFINVSILCTRFYKNQLHSHLKGCMHLGASKDDLKRLFKNLKPNLNDDNFVKSMNLINSI